MLKSLNNFAEFETELRSVIADIAKLQRSSPDPVFAYVEAQLKDLLAWSHGGARPTANQLSSLSFGKVASREIHDVNPALANRLYRLTSFLINWRA